MDEIDQEGYFACKVKEFGVEEEEGYVWHLKDGGQNEQVYSKGEGDLLEREVKAVGPVRPGVTHLHVVR